MSKVTAHEVRYGPAEHTWYEQQESIEDIQISLQGKKKTEKHSVQTLSAMVRTAANCGTPGDEKMIFVLREFSDETSWILDKSWPLWNDSSSSCWKSQERGAKSAWQQDGSLKAMKRLPPSNSRTCGTVSSQGDGIRYCTKPRSMMSKDVATNMQFKTRQLLFEVVHDVEGGRTRDIYFECWERSYTAVRENKSKLITALPRLELEFGTSFHRHILEFMGFLMSSRLVSVSVCVIFFLLLVFLCSLSPPSCSLFPEISMRWTQSVPLRSFQIRITHETY